MTNQRKSKNQRKSVLILDKVDFRERNVIRDQVRYFIIMKGSIYQKNVTILNIFALV